MSKFLLMLMAGILGLPAIAETPRTKLYCAVSVSDLETNANMSTTKWEVEGIPEGMIKDPPTIEKDSFRVTVDWTTPRSSVESITVKVTYDGSADKQHSVGSLVYGPFKTGRFQNPFGLLSVGNPDAKEKAQVFCQFNHPLED